MIFGFNTDIRLDKTVFHVQSEARQGDLLLQTQVFVKGQCIGKIASSYAALVEQPGFSDEQMHEILKEQHRVMVEAIRAGRVDEALGNTAALHVAATPAASNPARPTAVASSADFNLEFLNPETLYEQGTVRLRFRVTDGKLPVPGAKLVSRFAHTAADGTEADVALTSTVTGQDGIGEMRLAVQRAGGLDAVVLVQATSGTKVAKRKFRLSAPRL